MKTTQHAIIDGDPIRALNWKQPVFFKIQGVPFRTRITITKVKGTTKNVAWWYDWYSTTTSPCSSP